MVVMFYGLPGISAFLIYSIIWIINVMIISLLLENLINLLWKEDKIIKSL